MSNLQKRIYTSMIIFPLTVFFIIKGGFFLLSFLFIVFLAANYELFLVFSNKIIILFLNLILILALYSIVYLRFNVVLIYTLVWVIILCVCSDVGGYVFGKTFKGKKLTLISPNKTLSGVIGSFIFSLFAILIMDEIITSPIDVFIDKEDSTAKLVLLTKFLTPKYFFLSIIFSSIAQIGDLTISYFKRLEKVKDMGKILPGHGGIFDRIDSLMFVVILTFVLHKFNVLP